MMHPIKVTHQVDQPIPVSDLGYGLISIMESGFQTLIHKQMQLIYSGLPWSDVMETCHNVRRR